MTLSPDWTPEQIKICFIKKGKTQSSIAYELGVSHTSVSNVVKGKAKSDRIQQKIAEFLGIPKEKIWPSIYLRPGGPRKRGRPASIIAKQ